MILIEKHNNTIHIPYIGQNLSRAIAGPARGVTGHWHWNKETSGSQIKYLHSACEYIASFVDWFFIHKDHAKVSY